ncbi:gamma-glutamylcyclotransferase [Novosphingobium rhizovicinum]|uniref:Gamma-glutamylcyclotransferase n=1 Tax=Novosphingobium rhizovicinum TaxID=3228928 RepID=A0ABV3R9P9_9SPHN
MSRWLERHLSSWQSASVPGRLFAVRAPQGWYPALLPDTGSAPCKGVVCHAELGFGDLARLDRYEGAEYRLRHTCAHPGRRLDTGIRLSLAGCYSCGWRASRGR